LNLSSILIGSTFNDSIWFGSVSAHELSLLLITSCFISSSFSGSFFEVSLILSSLIVFCFVSSNFIGLGLFYSNFIGSTLFGSVT